MRSALASGQAFVMLLLRMLRMLIATLTALVMLMMPVGQTIEALGCVEVELVPPDRVLQPEEALHFLQLRLRVSYQFVCTLTHSTFNNSFSCSI